MTCLHSASAAAECARQHYCSVLRAVCGKPFCMQGLQRMVALLAVPQLRGAIVEGLVASIGGLDGSLSKATTAQLVSWLGAGKPALPAASAVLHKWETPVAAAAWRCTSMHYKAGHAAAMDSTVLSRT